jgi:hypothetical protein
LPSSGCNFWFLFNKKPLWTYASILCRNFSFIQKREISDCGLVTVSLSVPSLALSFLLLVMNVLSWCRLKNNWKLKEYFPPSSNASMAKWIRCKHQFLSSLVQTRNKLPIYSQTQILFVTWCLAWYFKESKRRATYLSQQIKRKHTRF